MRSLISQLRYTIRLLLKSPGFTITAVLILGSGIGLNTAIFSLINAVILKPLPFPHSEQLVALFMPYQNVDDMPFDYPDYEDIGAAQHSFKDLATFTTFVGNLTGRGTAERLDGANVSASMFDLSERPFLVGRPFTKDEDRSGGPLVVVLSEKFWRTHFNSDPGVIGISLLIDGRAFEVIGVAPAQVFEWRAKDVYLPIHLMRASNFTARDRHYFVCVGRLKPGVSPSQAQAELEVIHQSLIDRYPATDKGYRIRVTSLLETVISRYARTLWLLGGAVGCLFLIAAANIVNLILARAWDRRKEVAVRTAMGASRSRLVGQLLLEGACLSLLGAVVGLLITVVAIDAIKSLSPPNGSSRFQEVALDHDTLLFFCGVTLVSSLLFGLSPAWSRAGNDLRSSLQDEGSAATTHSRKRQRTQTVLVTFQVAFACILLIAAGLLIRSFQIVQTVPLGFKPDHVLTAQLYVTGGKYGRPIGTDPAAVAARTNEMIHFFDTLLEQARRLPCVTDAALNVFPPFDEFQTDPFSVSGETDSDPENLPQCATQSVSPGYFQTLQIPLLEGRDFSPDDRLGNQAVVIIDQAIAKRYFPNQSPIGRQFMFGGIISGDKLSGYRIIGVAHNVQADSPDQPQPAYQAYFPYSQATFYTETLMLRTSVDPHELIPAVRKLVTSVDPDIMVSQTITLDDMIANHSATRRLGVLLVSLFSSAALLLSAVGLYGVLAYSVSQRKREIGVRIALGAQTANILRLVVRHGLKIVGTGLVIGIGCALVLTRVIQGVLYGVSSSDPLVLVVAVCVLGLAALFACALPALRATRIDPIETLRE